MKILYCYRYGILGGVCTQLLNRIRVLSTEGGGFEAHLMFSRDYGIGRTLKGYPHLIFETDPRRIRKYAEDQDLDAVVVIDSPEFIDALSSLPGVPLILEVHTSVERGLRYLQERVLSPAGFIVPSQFSSGLLHQRFGFDLGSIAVVPNSLDETLFPRVTLSAIPSCPVFGWVGKLDEHKNWRGFLNVAACIRARGTEAEFWLVGGETAPESAEQELMEEAGRLNLLDCLRWFPRIEYRAMHRFYAAIRQAGGCMIVTSRAESFGMSVLEALMCGTPVVASEVGGIPEICPGKPYLQLYLFGEYDTAAELACRFLDTESGDEIRRTLEEERGDLEREYSQEAIGRSYLEILEAFAHGGSSLPLAYALDPDLEEALEDLSRYVPGGGRLIDSPVTLIRTASRFLDRRAYRVARVLAVRDPQVDSWSSLPSRLVQAIRKR